MRKLYSQFLTPCLVVFLLFSAGNSFGQGTGTVFLIRDHDAKGSTLRTDYTCNGTDIGALTNKSYMPLVLRAGKYVFTAQYEKYRNTT